MATNRVRRSRSVGNKLNDLESRVVSSEKKTIQENSIGSTQIANQGVATDNVQDRAVTASKIELGAVSTEHLSQITSLSSGGDFSVNVGDEGHVVLNGARYESPYDSLASPAGLQTLAFNPSNNQVVVYPVEPNSGENATGALNYVEADATNLTVSSGQPTLVSASITTRGYPLLISVSGSASPGSVAASGVRNMSVEVLRGATSFSDNFDMDGLDSDAALPFSFTTTDTPAAGSYTYNVRPAQTSASTWTWQRVHITIVELTGAVGPTGPAATPNYLINGGFEFWQRGTSSTTNSVYIADRWLHSRSAGTHTVSQSTDVPNGADVQYSLSFASTSGTAATITQRIESVNSLHFAGQSVTLSVWAKSTVGTGALAWSTAYPTVINNWAAETADTSGTFAGSMVVGDWTRYTATFTANALATRGYAIKIFRNVTTTSTTTLYAGVQLELGTAASQFRRAGSTYTEEQQACWRYYQLHDNIYGTSDGTYKFGTNPAGYLLRTTPTSILITTVSAPFSGTVLGSNISPIIDSRGGFYTTTGSLGSGGWVEFTGFAVTAEL